MRPIVDGLGRVLRDLVVIQASIDNERLIKEIVFSVVGLDPMRQTEQISGFLSLSGRTQWELEVKGEEERGQDVTVVIQAHLSPAERLTVSGVVNYEAARRTLNRRIDQAVRDFKNVRRRSGQQGSYEVFLEISKIDRSRTGVESCRTVLERVIEAMELL